MEDPYVVLKMISENKFAKVLKVQVIKTRRLYAIKTMDKVGLVGSKKRTPAKILPPHPNVVGQVSVKDSERKLTVVMECCESENLRHVLEEYKRNGRSLQEDKVIRYMAQILQGMKHIHSSKMLHYNLKPENILLDNSGDLKITDFGLLQNCFSRRSLKSSDYLSAEVLQGYPYTAADDVWSLGCIFHELCTLQLPYGGIGRHGVLEILDNELPLKISKKYSRGLKDFIARILNFSRNLRPTCKELLDSKLIRDFLNPNGNPHSEAKQYPNGDIYEGDFKNYKRHGKGVCYYENGDRYEGGFKRDERNGKGVFYCGEFVKYEGMWVNGKMSGKGKLYYACGSKYKGDFKDGVMEGVGIFDCVTGTSYKGEFKSGLYHGYGVFTSAKKESYKGEWRNGRKCGKGEYRYSNGDVYDGDWKDDKKCGQGIFHYSNGEIYEGEWKNNKKNGHGKWLIISRRLLL
eukprot:TRINITY_DN770_c0_g2_i3.p1 TRINITY_DN770_c0_g2~~TRINITY_DN770_c0_g2_i3.p1  ORF type:complete len:460 (+),score=123.50 TRINITY_DN770_c0_g2_i3:123-1502(+)